MGEAASARHRISIHMGRSIVAVIAGYLIFGLSAAVLFGVTGVDPHAPASMTFMIASTIYGIVSAALGAFVATKIAPTNPHIHAFVVAGVIDLSAIVSLVAQLGEGSSGPRSPRLRSCRRRRFLSDYSNWFGTSVDESQRQRTICLRSVCRPNNPRVSDSQRHVRSCLPPGAGIYRCAASTGLIAIVCNSRGHTCFANQGFGGADSVRNICAVSRTPRALGRRHFSSYQLVGVRNTFRIFCLAHDSWSAS